MPDILFKVFIRKFPGSSSGGQIRDVDNILQRESVWRNFVMGRVGRTSLRKRTTESKTEGLIPPITRGRPVRKSQCSKTVS